MWCSGLCWAAPSPFLSPLPTFVFRHYQISRIRAFYLRKVKFTQQNFHDKLTSILDEVGDGPAAAHLCARVSQGR